MAVMLLCLLLPLLFRLCSPAAPVAEKAAAEAAAQRRIDSAQHRADSITRARAARKATRDSLRAARRRTSTFTPTTRSRLDETITPPPR